MRLKRGTPSGDRAAQKWHATMLAKLGSEEAITEHYRTIGRKGGLKGAADGAIKGFAAMPYEKRAEAGRKGGRNSSRLGVRNGEGHAKRRNYTEDDAFVDEILES